jgi:sugar phosphate isomerase/epimerase
MGSAMRTLGIDCLGVFGLPPLAFVDLAADLGCAEISVALLPMPWNPCGFAPWSLRDDAVLRREMKAALRDRGVAISQGEGIPVRPGVDVRDQAGDLDLLAELGAPRISAVCIDRDSARGVDQLALLADLAAERGMELGLEFAPPQAINSLAGALAAIRAVGKPNMRVVLDAMHVFRSGAGVAEVAELDPALIGHVQLADAPRIAAQPDYLKEACFARLVPGEGELPLADFIAALPPNQPLGLEVPMEAAAKADGLTATMARVVAGARALLGERVSG